jgi:hypothetical protein
VAQLREPAERRRAWLDADRELILCGALVLAGAVGLWRSPGSRVVAVIIGVLALGMIGAGIFVVDAGLGYPPGERVPPRPTFHDSVHQLVSLIVFLALGLAPLVVAALTRSSRAWAAYCLLSGIVVLAFFAATVVVSAQEERIFTGAPIGLLQRVSVVAGLGWLSAYFLRGSRVNVP